MTVDRKRMRELALAAKRMRETWPRDAPEDRAMHIDFCALNHVDVILALLDALDDAEQPAPDDAVRFDWFFGPANKASFMGTYLLGCDRRWTPNEWREAIDAAILAQERTP